MFYLRFINSYVTKEEVLKIKNKYYLSYYCKDDICVESSYDYTDSYIEIPDKNGNITKYITYTCSNDNIISGSCHNETCANGVCQPNQCNNDLECLSNKCVKNYCTFNEETPIVHCDDIYSNKFILGKSSYMHCGKPMGDSCKSNDECSSKICTSDGVCNKQKKGPSDSDGIKRGIEILIIILIIVIIFVIIYGCYCRYTKKNKSRI